MSTLELFSLQDRIAVVTGAASGLGAAIAAGFVDAGATVYLTDINCDAISGNIDGERTRAIALDVADRDSVHEVVDRIITDVGRIDVLVNSAGIGGRAAAENYPPSLWDKVLAVNLTGTFNVCRAVGHRMLAERSGSIINIASIGGLVGFPGSVGYQVSKGGVVQLTRTLAVEWGERGVRVNAIAPSQFDTATVRRQWEAEPELKERFRKRTALGRIGQPDEIVGPALFLASDASAMVTGHVLTVDAGYTVQ